MKDDVSGNRFMLKNISICWNESGAVQLAGVTEWGHISKYGAGAGHTKLVMIEYKIPRKYPIQKLPIRSQRQFAYGERTQPS